ncbi:MAG: hypothetical protein V3T17_14640 [Pseudomonadales bacterium]
MSEYVLAVFGFDRDYSSNDGSHLIDPRYIETGLTLIGQEHLREVWYSSTPVSSGIDADVRWVSNGCLLLVSVTVNDPTSENMHIASYQAYKRLLSVIAERDYPYIIRAWNYLADINDGEGDSERYKRFCSGRYEAFIECNHDLHQFPAACALGHQGGPMVIYLLASTEPPFHFENPQQVSAYHYPREYGPRAPSFARATLKFWHGCAHVYISGTASIVGYQSLHQGDVAQQLEVTFDNIERLLIHIQASNSLTQLLQTLMLKVYIRNLDDYDLIKTMVERQYGSNTRTVYVEADICRQELEVEIDGMCVIPMVVT